MNPINKIKLNSIYANNRNQYLLWKKGTFEILKKHDLVNIDLTDYNSNNLKLFKDSVHMYDVLQDDVLNKVFQK